MFSENEVWLLVVIENTCLRHDVLAQHGVSFLISYYGKKYLFDCGQIFLWLEYNFDSLKLDANELEAVIISHDHYDHCNALSEFVSTFESKKIYVPDGFSSFEHSKIVEVDKSFEIEKWLFLTWSLGWGEVKEQSLVMDFGEKWIMIVVGCSHPGLKNIISKAQKITWNEKIMWLIGWFHLVESNVDEIQKTIDYLKTLDLWFIIPGHCTWIDAVQIMKEQLGDKIKTSLMWSIGVGNHIRFVPELKINLI